MIRHPSSRQNPPKQPGVYLVSLCPGDPGELMRWVHGAFRLGACVRPYWSWEAVDGLVVSGDRRLWPTLFEGKRK